MIELNQEYVQSIFDYTDGILYWKVVNSNCIHIGDKAGGFGNRYYRVKINGMMYPNHQIIFLYHHGFIPNEIDHIDNDPLNNNIENLREVTHQQNMMNKKSYKNTSSKYKGITWDKQHQKWRVRIGINGKNKYLGLFTNEEKAAEVYNKAAIELYGEYAYLNKI